MLQRFDAETTDVGETEHEAPATKAFLARLSEWENEELDERMMKRVEFSKRAVAKLVQAFDRISQRNAKIAQLLQNSNPENGAGNAKPDPEIMKKLDEELIKRNGLLAAENNRLQQIVADLQVKFFYFFAQISLICK